MYVIIPIGDYDTQFYRNEYNLPKCLIPSHGVPIIFRLIDTIQIAKILIVYHKNLKQYRFEDRIFKRYKNSNISFICVENTSCCVDTLKYTKDFFKNTNVPVIIFDSDNYYSVDILSVWKRDNGVFAINEIINNKSKITCDDSMNVIDISESSNKTCNYSGTGIYAFKSSVRFFESLDDCKFVSEVIMKMISKDNTFHVYHVKRSEYHQLGTPFQLQLFQPKTNPVLKFCFDLDNTLVTFPKVPDDYTTVEPIFENVSMVRHLKSLGHYIIVYTARGMKSRFNNVGKIIKDLGQITLETLQKFEIPYDEIVFGKPNADYYIDDLAISSYDNLEKALGFYKNDTEPRDFNSIMFKGNHVIKSSCKSLRSEIEYYQNLPLKLTHLFPKLIHNDSDYKWYSVQKINGISCSKLYIKQILTNKDLINIIQSIQKIHTCTDCIESYELLKSNYCTKMKSRFENYDYSNFENSTDVFKCLYNELHSYQEAIANFTFIHGDTVLSNIILDSNENPIFIDPRGLQNDTITPYGDPYYDFAKLYQSLIGYDEVMENTFIDLKYKESMINTFESFFSKEEMRSIKIICRSLLFTLIPLHNNDKCYKYYDLIKSIN